MGLWSGIKYAINSSLGTDKFEPLDVTIRNGVRKQTETIGQVQSQTGIPPNTYFTALDITGVGTLINLAGRLSMGTGAASVTVSFRVTIDNVVSIYTIISPGTTTRSVVASNSFLPFNNAPKWTAVASVGSIPRPEADINIPFNQSLRIEMASNWTPTAGYYYEAFYRVGRDM